MQLKLSDQDYYSIQLCLVLILFLISRKTLTSLVNIYKTGILLAETDVH